ncbi:hypothetical protein TNCV_5103611 [Trichonephila clavipes]|nr:hypothetical protein TNCV_5103611 [Trichonephila clavipes]
MVPTALDGTCGNLTYTDFLKEKWPRMNVAVNPLQTFGEFQYGSVDFIYPKCGNSVIDYLIEVDMSLVSLQNILRQRYSTSGPPVFLSDPFMVHCSEKFTF